MGKKNKIWAYTLLGATAIGGLVHLLAGASTTFNIALPNILGFFGTWSGKVQLIVGALSLIFVAMLWKKK